MQEPKYVSATVVAGKSEQKPGAGSYLAVGLIVVLIAGAVWCLIRKNEREDRRRRELLGEVGFMVNSDGAKILPRHRDSLNRMDQINRRYDRPIWESVPPPQQNSAVPHSSLSAPVPVEPYSVPQAPAPPPALTPEQLECLRQQYARNREAQRKAKEIWDRYDAEKGTDRGTLWLEQCRVLSGSQ